MRTTTASVHKKPPTPAAPAYPPSVPLSVYRELAIELQTAQAKLDALTAKNQQLAQENQLLRQEITKVIQSFSHLQKLVGLNTTPTTSSDRQVPHTSPNTKSAVQHPAADIRPRQQVPRPRPSSAPEVPNSKSSRSNFSVPVAEMMSPMPQPVFIEEQEVKYYRPTKPEAKEVSGWWLVITILLIMLTAFSAGYLIVRPLFEHQSR
ncbi:MAG: hypothetical protein KME32_08340 [Mojavia pulchra JT2-VF2]|jgi:hypothetical protein|uniref:Uncharacterized protein n=1 Tax=Mojavia pulchra JT2-VF2 TaxID=287848 RepID=A0A951PXC3_9NOST|nr:hypothetical protein [Mojavia pulchra JT2-VF2]